MNYIALRDCYVGECFRYKGDIYDLPDDFPISEKNFRLADEQKEEVKEPETFKELSDALVEDVKEVAPKVKPDDITDTKFWCTECKRTHFKVKQNGKPNAHLKFAG